ncbi:platelet-activating factor acetyltransferase [Aureococcus anophagefferens]|nr:platelet-activating factor acetyltransferase [Aureococcus anophagefferens]
MGRQLSLGVLGRFLPSPVGRPSDGASTKDAPRKDAPKDAVARSFGAGRRDSSQASLGGENYSGTLGDASFEAMEDLTAGAVDDDEGGDIMGFCLNGQEAILPESLLYWDYVMCFFILV